MKQVQRRAGGVLLLVLGLLAGLVFFFFRYFAQGKDWTDFWESQEFYRAGMLHSGRVLDRNGVVLSEVREGERVYAETADTRTACFHVVGDKEGNVGAGVLSQYAGVLAGYEDLPGSHFYGEPVLALGIDEALNRVAMEAMGQRKGAVLLSDYTTGDILCMYSSPACDPLAGVPLGDAWYDSVYLNRCIGAAYTPGSVFKLVTAAAALEQLPDVDERTFFCGGSLTVDGSELRCTGIHGTQTLEQALANSCNCAFARISLELGGEVLAEYAEKLGFTDSVAVGSAFSAAGKVEAAPAGSTALAWSGVGQSTDLVCPVAMLRYVAAIANGGVIRELSLLAGRSRDRDRLLNARTAARLKSMMHYNVVTGYGEQRFPGLTKLCAKTGTAELGDGTSHAWFAGFLDDPAHPYAFTVIVEQGGGGLQNAAPVANALLQAATRKDAPPS